MLLCFADAPIGREAHLMLISHMMLSLVHSCCTKQLPLGVDYVTQPAAGVVEGSKGRKRKETLSDVINTGYVIQIQAKYVTIVSSFAARAYCGSTRGG